MEASEAGTEAPQETPEQPQEAAPAQVPPEISERLNELSEWRGEMQPVLQRLDQALQPPEPEQPNYQDYIDPEGGYVLNPEEFDQSLSQRIQQAAEQVAEQKYGPLQQQVEQMQQQRQFEELQDLADELPQLRDEKFMETFEPELVNRAQQVVASLGLSGEAAQQAIQKLRFNADFIEQNYLARSVGQQAQQGVPAGGQEVPLEGGSGSPGQPETDPTQEWSNRMAGNGSASFWGKPLDQL